MKHRGSLLVCLVLAVGASWPWDVACPATHRLATSQHERCPSISSPPPRRPTRPPKAETPVRCSSSVRSASPRSGGSSRRDDVLVAISTLLQGPTADEAAQGLRTAIPSGTRLLAADLKDGVLTIDLSKDFLVVQGSEQRTAVAQLVFTATGTPDVDKVLFAIEGTQKEVPIDDGSLSAAPLTRFSYPSLDPIRLPPPTPGARCRRRPRPRRRQSLRRPQPRPRLRRPSRDSRRRPPLRFGRLLLAPLDNRCVAHPAAHCAAPQPKNTSATP